MKWTADQQKAIDARDGTLLVSAAAGSGKTAVLVERVIQRICDSEKPCGVENLLIVTFTNAAAAQMKEKIHNAIGKKIAQSPSDKRLRRQQLMLPCASICTIDSFCIGLVRENFHELGVAPDFSLLDEGKLSIMRSQAVNSVVDKLHEEGSDSFLTLSELISDKKDDSKLISAILKLYNLSMAYPFPEKWLDSIADNFANPLPIKDSYWGKSITEYITQLIGTCKSDAEHCIRLLADEPELEAKYRPVFEEDIRLLESLEENICSNSWDENIELFSNLAFVRMATAPKGYESSVKEICKSTRDAYKKLASGACDYLCVSENEHREDVKLLSPVISELVQAVKKFSEEFKRLKNEENGADFSDTLHMALELLIKPTENGYEKTPLALELSENYAEILVDEYQDVNEAQDMIFRALSKEGESNLFMVGDVKQSIYRFRQAMPEIFLSRRDGLKKYEIDNYPAKVTLGKNFRSRKGVTEAVNFIFSALMSRKAGGLDYDKNEFLEAAATYPQKKNADTEICLIETEKQNFLSAQAKYVADYIEKAITEGITFTKDGEETNADYGDFCILLRSVKNCSKEFIDEFTARGIPFVCEAGGGFLTSPEIMFMTSLLKTIDNPVDDIPLTAVMLSPVFGFTPDDLAQMRTARRKGNFYHCLVQSADEGNKKSADFLLRLSEMRRIAATVMPGELVRRLIEETGYNSIVSSVKDSSKRRANLNNFIDLANKYESTGKKGVSGFIRYIDNIIKSGSDLNLKETGAEDTNAVKIMTIHKSKGLEFPVCFVGACEKKYGDLSLKEDLLIASKSGIGIKNIQGNSKFDTLSRMCAKLEIKNAEHSEELRVLYVALTRPKEKLIVLASSEDWSRELSKISANIREDKLIDPFKVNNFTSYSECLLSAMIRHPDAHALRNTAGISASISLPCETPVETKIIGESEYSEIIHEEIQAKADSGILSEIKSRLSFIYPYESLDGIIAKRIASKLDSESIGGEYFASKQPAFAGKDELTPAQRGTATHRFMQYADYNKASQSVESELCRLTDEGMLTDAEARVVDKKAVALFFESELAKRILNAEKVYKEYAFTCAIPVCEIEPSVKSSDEVIIIEGVADCAFVENGSLIIVDFKTDRARNVGELAEKYREQLAIYRRCLGEVMDLPVKQTLIYSFKLHETVEIQ